MERLATGISVLDRKLDGGLPPGTVVVLKADPASQSELFLNTFTHVRETLYLTTVRSADAVTDALDASVVRTGDPVVESVHGSAPLSSALNGLSELPEGGTLIVDSAGPLEAADGPAYRSFLNDLETRVTDAGAIAVIHALKSDTQGQNRILTEQMADVVFDLRTSVTGTEIINRLTVPKFRGGAALEEPVKLRLTDTVSVDTSRDIA